MNDERVILFANIISNSFNCKSVQGKKHSEKGR